MKKSNNTAKLIGALLLGTAIGAALGILFAPAKGSETRKKIAGSSDDLSNALKEKLNLETERDLNARILKVTMKIKKECPELSKFIEEMPVTIPDEKHPEITLKNLKAYYDSLDSVLKKYKLEHPTEANC